MEGNAIYISLVLKCYLNEKARNLYISLVLKCFIRVKASAIYISLFGKYVSELKKTQFTLTFVIRVKEPQFIFPS